MQMFLMWSAKAVLLFGEEVIYNLYDVLIEEAWGCDDGQEQRFNGIPKTRAENAKIGLSQQLPKISGACTHSK